MAPSSAPPQPPRARRFGGARTVLALMLREMATTNGRSPGGYLWAILEPVGGIFLLSLIFSLAFRHPQLGTSFAAYYATGLVPFVIFTSISNKLGIALQFSKPLLAYRPVTFIDAIVARFALNMLTETMVAYLIFTGVIVLFHERTHLDILTIAISLALAGYLGLGVGVLNCYLYMRFPVWQQLWGILMRPMVLLAGVVILFDSVPQPWRDYLWYNPLVHVIGLTRRGFYQGYDASYVSVIYVIGFASICLLFGLLFLRHSHRDLLNI